MRLKSQTRWSTSMDKIDKFMKDSGINCVSNISAQDDNICKCEICGEVFLSYYRCMGYNPTTKKIQGPYDICFDCLYKINYGVHR